MLADALAAGHEPDLGGAGLPATRASPGGRRPDDRGAGVQPAGTPRGMVRLEHARILRFPRIVVGPIGTRIRAGRRIHLRCVEQHPFSGRPKAAALVRASEYQLLSGVMRPTGRGAPARRPGRHGRDRARRAAAPALRRGRACGPDPGVHRSGGPWATAAAPGRPCAGRSACGPSAAPDPSGTSRCPSNPTRTPSGTPGSPPPTPCSRSWISGRTGAGDSSAHRRGSPALWSPRGGSWPRRLQRAPFEYSRECDRGRSPPDRAYSARRTVTGPRQPFPRASVPRCGHQVR